MNLPTATLVIVAGLMLALVPIPAPSLTFEQRWEPVKQLPAMQDKAPRELTFEERWEPVRRLPPMLIRTEPEELTPRVIPVRTITIRREDVEPPIEEASSAEVPLPQARPVQASEPRRTIRKASLDICQRHGMHKQITRGGKSWRCRR